MTPVRYHRFRSGEVWESRACLLRMAMCLVPTLDDVDMCEALADAYDDAGLDDNGVSANFGSVVDGTDDIRERTERMLIAVDLLRRAARTAH